MTSYAEMCRDVLASYLSDVSTLTDRQAALLAEPVIGPENYYMDGEISPAEARRYYLQRARALGVEVEARAMVKAGRL